MSNEDRMLKNLIEISIIVFSISIILFGISFPIFLLGGLLAEYYDIITGTFVASEILMALSGIAIFVATIIMIVKICTNTEVKTGDKVLWGILVYLFNSFILPFAFNKFVLKTNDNKGAIRLVIFEGISFALMIVSFILLFFKMIDIMIF